MRVGRCTGAMVEVPVGGKFCKEGTGKLGAIITVEELWYAMLSKQFLRGGYHLGSITLGWRYLMDEGHL